jgi:hypothetical protein
MWVGASRAVLAAQSAAIGLGGSMALLLGMVTVAAGAGVLWPLLFAGAGLLLFGAAGALWWLRSRLKRVLDRWRMAALVTELALGALGVALVDLATYAEAQAGSPGNPGTDGPFADGGCAMILLLGCAFIAGAALVAVGLLWDAARLVRARLSQRAGDPPTDR